MATAPTPTPNLTGGLTKSLRVLSERSRARDTPLHLGRYSLGHLALSESNEAPASEQRSLTATEQR